MSKLKISKFTCHEVMVPALKGVIASDSLDKPLHKLPVGAKVGWSVQFDQLPKLILEMELANGVTGLGELYRNHDWNQVENIISMLLGMSLDEFPLQKLPIVYSREYDGFECAIYDAYAKAHNLRVVDLLGGPVRNKIKIGAWSSHRTTEEIGDWAAQYYGQGYDCIKFKTDLEDNILGWCKEIDAYAPGMKIILDPNERWNSSFETRKRIEQIQEIGNVLCLEDPIPRWQLDEYAALRNFGSIPIVLHVSLPYVLHGQRMYNTIQAIQKQAVDGFNFNGGAAHFRQMASIADAAELPYWHGSEIDLGILEAMYIHCCAASERCIWPSDIFGRMIREHDLLDSPLGIEPPYINLPLGPGLGVSIDQDALKEYTLQSKEYSI